MAKGYLNDPPLQTNAAAESSTLHNHIGPDNCGSQPPGSCSTLAHDEFSGAACGYRL